MSESVDEHVRTELVRFVRALRRRGVDVAANAGTVVVRALAEVGLTERTRARTALRASLVSDSDDFETFDRLFETFWTRLTAGAAAELGGDQEDTDGQLAPFDGVSADARGDGESADDDETETTGRSLGESFDSTASESGDDADAEEFEAAVYSPSGAAEPVDESVRSLNVDGLDGALDDLAASLASLRGRRYRRGGDAPDPRRLLRESASTGGTVVSIPRRERRPSAVRALFVVDVSRSVLDTVDRDFLVEFLRRATHAWRDVRVFFFDEDVREVTEAMRADSVRAARDALRSAETAWGGGTRIGGSLARLRQTAPDAVDRRTVAFVVSDGLEMGDVTELERELSWLTRRTRRILWLNPLAAAESYEPTASGMAAALPYVDGLFAFASPDDVAELARQLRRQGPGGRIGYEFDPRSRGGPEATRQTTTTDP